jgi:type IX secretion system PorP/SprF family membrane protein
MMKMKKILLVFLVAGLLPGAFGQQQPQFNMYMFNKVVINPAVAGTSGAICLTGFGRNQWMGYQDMNGGNISPRTYGLSYDMPIYAIKSGAGFMVQYDLIGFERNFKANLNYAFHQVFSNNHMLSFGLSLGILNKTIDYTMLEPAEPDPSLPADLESGTITDIGFGVHYRVPRRFFAGFSVANILGSSSEIGSGVDFQLSRHYYLFGGYEIEMEDKYRRPVVVTPGFLMKATNGAVKVDINAIVTWNDFIWGGILYRIENAVGVMAGVNYYGFSAGVSYDITMNADFQDRSSIELFVRYCYKIYPGVIKKSGYNTRNL